MLAILAPIFVFGLVIFVHELGHFLAAKAVGVYTPRFSIGFGPALWRRRRGETEYVLAALPLGGYVRMASRHDEATAFLEGGSEEATAKAKEDPNFDPNAMIPFGPKPVPENRWFESKPFWARMFILLAGVTMNFMLGLAIAIGLALHFGKVVIPTRVVGAVRPVNGQPLLSQAIRPGDTLRRVNLQPVKSWSDAMGLIVRSRDSVAIETNRGAVTIPLSRPGSPRPEDIVLAMDYALAPVIGDLLPNEPAVKAGFQPGDSIVAIDGVPVRSWSEMVVLVANAAGKTMRFEIVRKGAPQTLVATPRPMDSIHPVTGVRTQVGKIGAYPVDVTGREPVSFGEAVSLGARTTWFMGTSIIATVRDLVTRRQGLDQLGGPIAITRASVQAARSGLESLFYLIALLSVNVAILNLLPIPVLDGGNILITIVESVRGSPLSLRAREYVLRGGLLIILLLFLRVMFNDAVSWLR